MARFTEQLFVSPFVDGAGRDIGLELFNEDFIRPLPFGSNWTKLRIAVLMGLGQTANGPATTLPNALVDIGVCSGNRLGIGSTRPVNYVGVGYGGGDSGRTGTAGAHARGIELVTTTGGWTASGSGSGNATHYRTAQHGLTVDSYFDTGSQGAVYFYGPNSALCNGVYRRGMLVVDIQLKSSTAYVSSLYYFIGGIFHQCDLTMLNVVDACEGAFGAGFTTPAYNLDSISMNNMAYANVIPFPTIAYAYTGSAGPLDCVNIAWNQSVCALTIWGVAVTRYL